MNYTIPLNASNAVWQVDLEGNHNLFNISIPDYCMNLSFRSLDLMINQSNIPDDPESFYCHANDTYIHILTVLHSQRLAEEAIYWNISAERGSFPTNISIYLNNTNIYNKAGDFNETVNISVDLNFVNGMMAQKNDILFNVHSDNLSVVLQINLLNATYSFNVDNCSNQEDIPDNATFLNISFEDLLNNSVFVNLTSIINYGNRTFVNGQQHINFSQICIYPSYYSIPFTSAFQYQDFAGVNYYNYPAGTMDSNTKHLIFYISTGTNTATFTLKDNVNRQIVIPNVRCDQYIFLNGIYTPLETKFTDIAGQVIFNYLQFTNYKFICSANGYQTYSTILNPIQAATYDIFLVPTGTTTYSNNFDRLSINTYPHIFYEGNNNFSLTITSFYNELSSYGYTLIFPGGTVSGTGNNPAGEIMNTSFVIVAPSMFDNVELDITYSIPLFGNHLLRYFYPIGNTTTNTLSNPPNNDPTYGMGIIERLLIVVFGMIVIVGLCYLTGMEIPGVFFGFIWSGYWCYVQFVPLWAFLPSIFVALVIVAGRS